MKDPTAQMKIVQEKLIKNEIPVLLTKLVQAGKKDEALTLLISWGTHEKDNHTIWSEAKTLL